MEQQLIRTLFSRVTEVIVMLPIHMLTPMQKVSITFQRYIIWLIRNESVLKGVIPLCRG
ncbi:hypothetical protein QNH39_04800 [Neobacillus novalis]|uniref:Uncharacterized protein n=1 Tax=Neobacillus novalis TaxID=220687 RepID=A0AA95MPR0_9BACI|nr:hypothetical protein [Neobacillus novalis]WHY87182.1 hypothetical protein QNH39_04800 [Neobacillus novalis]